jgi:hypothetical protein
MKVLIACEESQVVTIEMRNLGIDAFSCDILPCSGGFPKWHLQQDVSSLLNEKWTLIIAFPPCTYLTNASSVRLKVKGEINKERMEKAKQAKEFFMKFINADCKYIAVENPVPGGIHELPKYSQIIQPYEFGHAYSKKTCLWLKNLPDLVPTKIIKKHEPYINGGYKDKNGKYRQFKGRNERDSKTRSKTFPGIAKAMAEQWISFIKSR